MKKKIKGHWDKPLVEQVYVGMRHVVPRFMERAGYPENYNPELAQQELRYAIAEVIGKGETIRGDDQRLKRRTEFWVRVALPNREPVFVIVSHGDAGGRYEYLADTTVLTPEMYNSGGSGRLGTLSDHPAAAALAEVKPAPTPEPLLKPPRLTRAPARGEWIVVVGDNMHPVAPGSVQMLIFKALAAGVRQQDIRIYSPKPLTIGLEFGDPIGETDEDD